MRIVELIQRKRDGGELSREEIEFFLQGHLRAEIPDYQAAALLMAVFFTGLSDPELVDWTESMARLATPLDLSDLPGPKLGKQSTGGVGDKTSLIVGPLVAAAEITVPMIAGRGAAYTGGQSTRGWGKCSARCLSNGLSVPKPRNVRCRWY